MASRIAGIALIVAGATGFVVFLVGSILGIFAGLQRVDTPGATPLELEPGSHTIYWEVPGHRKPGGAPDGLRVEVGGLALEPAGPMKARYSTSSRAGVSIYAFEVPAKGAYTVTVAGSALPPGSVVISRSTGFFGILKIVLGGLLILGVGVGGGVLLIVRSLKTPA